MQPEFTSSIIHVPCVVWAFELCFICGQERPDLSIVELCEEKIWWLLIFSARYSKVQCLFSVENHIFSQKIPVARTFLWKGGLLLMWQIMVVLSKCSRRPAFAYERYLLNWSCAANVFGQTGLWVPRHLISIVFEAFPNPKKWLWQIALCFLLIYW